MKATRLPWILFAAYVAALLFGVGGIAVALRRPDLWAHLELGRAVYAFGMRWGGVAYIVLGAAALFVYAWQRLGPQRTLAFFTLSVTISLAAELIGTSTGWPFGNYSYTAGLGPKVLDRVPFTIPLSWFTVGLASWLLGSRLVAQLRTPWRTLLGIVLGVWLLVVWDLVLDPAMAHEAMQARFWVWHQTGSYYGMPVINFAGWALTGLLFTTAARLAWRDDPPRSVPLAFPYAIYAANIAFAAALCATVNLWGPILLSVLAGLFPATLALLQGRERTAIRATNGRPTEPVVEQMAWRFLRSLARGTLRGRQIRLLGSPLPATGPAILAPQHIHHLDDGRALLATVQRPLRFLVALDWVPSRRWRWLMERLCALAGWPVIVRPSEITRPGIQYSPAESRVRLLSGLREAVARIAAGQLLVVFPEGFPIVDPHLPDRRQPNQPLRPGAIWLARRAAARAGRPIPVYPVRLRYAEHAVELFVEEPLLVDAESPIDVSMEQLATRLHSDGVASEPSLIRPAMRKDA